MKISICLLLSTVLLLPLVPAQAAPADNAALSALQRKLVERFQARDLDGIMSCYVPGERLLVFDVVIPRQYVGAKAYRKDWADLLAALPGPLQAEIIDPFVETEGNMGYGHMIVHYVMTDKDGHKLDLTARVTDIYRKINGKWLVVHEHTSFPVDFTTGKADMQSKP